MREVFYIAGFDPRSPKYYYSIFKNNIHKTSAIEQNELNISKFQIDDSPYFNVDYKGVKTKYNFLIWNDIVKEHFCKRFFEVFGALFVALFNYPISGAVYMVARYSRTQLIAGYYPIVFILLSYFLTGFFCYGLSYFIQNYILWIICSILLFYLATKGIFYLGMNAGMFWLLSIYRFCYKYARSEIKGADERNESFANEIIKSLKNNQNTNDEVMIVAHSVGAIIAISSVARVIEKSKIEGLNISNLKLVLIGGCIPLVSFHKYADKFKKELEIVANSGITWLDFSSKIDGACFFKVDYIKLLRQNAKSPKLISVGFFKIYDKKTYKNIRYKWYQVHFLYLKATQIRGGYDYFYLTIDPDKLEDKKF
ncbi:hypothetical protein [Campylobacter devanensis]|uniref:hypothetical protein n=1 Tax=Campylobacter devanensis TaxID=3161138 RepID=UPI00112FB2ED|nr:hypothetical protein [Campylobacter sp. P0222]